MPGFINDATLKQAVSDALKQSSPSNLSPPWDGHVSDGNAMAWSDIVGALTLRGYTSTQIANWDRGAIVQKLQGLYWAFVLGAGLHPYDDRFIKQWDQRQQLANGALDIGGVSESPQSEPLIQFGLLRTDNDKWDEKNFRM